MPISISRRSKRPAVNPSNLQLVAAMFYSICYDIGDDRRRLKIAKLLKDFGERVQYSVFEANLERDQLDRLKRRAMSILDPEEDLLRIYPLCAGCATRIEILGHGKITQDPEFIIV